MRIPTTAFYDRSIQRMGVLNDKADALQTQISTRTRLTTASQDAAGWQRLTGLKQAAADDTAWAANVALAQGLLAQTDGALGQVETLVSRARELAIQGNSGALDATSRETVAVQLDGIVADLAILSGATDQRGQRLFDVDMPAAIPIGANASVQATERAARIFGGIDAPEGTIDLGAAVAALAAALRAGTDVPGATADALSALEGGSNQISTARASVGARAMRMEVESANLSTAAIDREEARSGIEDTDIPATIIELQKTLTVLQATQASFGKLSSLSLFDYLR